MLNREYINEMDKLTVSAKRRSSLLQIMNQYERKIESESEFSNGNRNKQNTVNSTNPFARKTWTRAVACAAVFALVITGIVATRRTSQPEAGTYSFGMQVFAAPEDSAVQASMQDTKSFEPNVTFTVPASTYIDENGEEQTYTDKSILYFNFSGDNIKNLTFEGAYDAAEMPFHMKNPRIFNEYVDSGIIPYFDEYDPNADITDARLCGAGWNSSTSATVDGAGDVEICLGYDDEGYGVPFHGLTKEQMDQIFQVGDKVTGAADSVFFWFSCSPNPTYDEAVYGSLEQYEQEVERFYTADRRFYVTAELNDGTKQRVEVTVGFDDRRENFVLTSREVSLDYGVRDADAVTKYEIWEFCYNDVLLGVASGETVDSAEALDARKLAYGLSEALSAGEYDEESRVLAADIDKRISELFTEGVKQHRSVTMDGFSAEYQDGMYYNINFAGSPYWLAYGENFLLQSDAKITGTLRRYDSEVYQDYGEFTVIITRQDGKIKIKDYSQIMWGVDGNTSDSDVSDSSPSDSDLVYS